jgi:hypothetical protein
LLEQRVKQLEADLAVLVKERQRIEHDVALITQRAKTQPDLLDEQARAVELCPPGRDHRASWQERGTGLNGASPCGYSGRRA